MGKVLDFVVNLSMVTSGNFDQRVLPAIDAISKLQQKTRELQKTSGQISSYQKQSASITQLEQKAAKARERYEQLGRQVSDTSKPNAKLKADYAQALQQYEKLNDSLNKQKQNLEELGRTLESAGVKTGELSRHQSELQSSLTRTQEAQQRLTAAQNKYSQLRAKLDWSNIKMDVMKSAAIIAAFKQPVTVAMNFDQAMAQVRAVKTMTAEEFEKLETQAMELGASTQFSATQAANTQENLARAGMSIPDITAALPAVLSMAGAEGMDLAQAGSIIAKGLGGMNLEGKFAGRLADVLAYTSASSNTNIVEIGDAFKVVAPVLSKQGATMEQIASYIGVMANKGYTGSEAGNALASTTMRLANLPKKARDKLLNIGLDSRMFKTKEGRMVELPEIMKMIDSAMKAKNLGEFEQLDILSEVFGKSQGKAMSAFMSASAAGDADIMQNGVYNDSFGKAAEMNRTRNNTLKGDITSLSSAWEGLMIAIGKPLDAVNRSVVQVVTELLQKTTKFINENKDLMRIALRVGYIFGGWRVLGVVLKYGALLVKLPFAKLAVMGAAANAEAVAAGKSVGLLGHMFGLLFHPIARLEAAFSGLWALCLAHPFVAVFAAGAALIGLITHWDKLKSWWNSWTIDDVFAKLPSWAQEDIAKLKELWAKYWPDWKARAEEAINWVGNLMKKLIDKLSSWLDFELPSWLGGGNAGVNQVRNAGAALTGGNPPAIAPGNPIISHTGGTGQFNSKLRGADAHALGGIFSRPHIGLVAEAGPEAIIPLRDKSRGLEVLTQTAQILGVPIPENFSNKDTPIRRLSSSGQVINHSSILTQSREMMNYVSQAGNNIFDGSNSTVRDSSMTFTPTYNITVTGDNSQSVGENIRAVIEDTMNEILSRMERVSFA